VQYSDDRVSSGQALRETSPNAQPYWLLAVGVLLVAEICFLTVAFEFSNGAMADVARPEVASFALMAAALGILLCGRGLLKLSSPSRVARSVWIAANLLTFFGLFLWTRRLHDSAADGEASLLAVTFWALLAALVGSTALLSCFDPRGLARWLRTNGHYLFAAAIIALTFVLCVADIQHLWSWAGESSIAIAVSVLERVQSDTVVTGQSLAGNPILGLDRSGSLEVTRFCAEMESLVAFLILGITLFVATWSSSRPFRFLIVMAVGVIVLYVFNSVRLAGLVGVRRFGDDGVLAVKLAHSRISGILFLALSLSILLISHPWWHKNKA